MNEENIHKFQFQVAIQCSGNSWCKTIYGVTQDEFIEQRAEENDTKAI